MSNAVAVPFETVLSQLDWNRNSVPGNRDQAVSDDFDGIVPEAPNVFFMEPCPLCLDTVRQGCVLDTV